MTTKQSAEQDALFKSEVSELCELVVKLTKIEPTEAQLANLGGKLVTAVRRSHSLAPTGGLCVVDNTTPLPETAHCL